MGKQTLQQTFCYELYIHPDVLWTSDSFLASVKPVMSFALQVPARGALHRFEEVH